MAARSLLHQPGLNQPMETRGSAADYVLERLDATFADFWAKFEALIEATPNESHEGQQPRESLYTPAERQAGPGGHPTTRSGKQVHNHPPPARLTKRESARSHSGRHRSPNKPSSMDATTHLDRGDPDSLDRSSRSQR
ncbi:Hypothetical predicted protein [Pelobates cultripes]|uniref:Uncharacterized protein n=1 Tax=Pelobates cultripes TaxID=61616 RepID=A0AAD1RW36_PELCU|nr:Hypothetical predicted protein [Pelobates cultripes]